MPPRSSSPICERSLDLTLIGIGRRDISQCSSKHFHMEAFYRTFSGGHRPSVGGATSVPSSTIRPRDISATSSSRTSSDLIFTKTGRLPEQNRARHRRDSAQPRSYPPYSLQLPARSRCVHLGGVSD